MAQLVPTRRLTQHTVDDLARKEGAAVGHEYKNASTELVPAHITVAAVHSETANLTIAARELVAGGETATVKLWVLDSDLLLMVSPVGRPTHHRHTPTTAYSTPMHRSPVVNTEPALV